MLKEKDRLDIWVVAQGSEISTQFLKQLNNIKDLFCKTK